MILYNSNSLKEMKTEQKEKVRGRKEDVREEGLKEGEREPLKG